MQCLAKAASWLCEKDAAAQDTAAPQLAGATLLDRQLKLLNLTNLSAEDFSRKEGVVADQKWLELAIASQRKVEPSLWMLYREWVDDVIDGQVEHVDAWHHFVVARAFGLNPSLTKSVKPGEAADLLALLAEDRKLGDSTANESLESWLEESREAFDFRFRKAHHRCFDGLSFAEEGDWQGSFSFVQIADPQLGMLHGDRSWEEERAMLSLAVQHINKLKPRFLLVSGDMSNAWPVGPQADAKAAAKQVNAVKEVLREVDSSIPIVLVAGNHDIGQVPSPNELDLYSSRWGDDYFSFWVGGVYFMVINSQFYMDSSKTPNQRKDQDTWIEAQFEALKKRKPKHAVVLSHVPPFIEEPDEPQGWANWETEPRARIVKLAKEAGVRLWLCGHYHGNADAYDDDLEVVTCASVGSNINWIEEPGVVATSTRPNFEKCVGEPPFYADAQHSGLRIVRFDDEGSRHDWFLLADMPPTLDDAFRQDGNFNGSPRRRRRRTSEVVKQRLGLPGPEETSPTRSL